MNKQILNKIYFSVRARRIRGFNPHRSQNKIVVKIV